MVTFIIIQNTCVWKYCPTAEHANVFEFCQLKIFQMSYVLTNHLKLESINHLSKSTQKWNMLSFWIKTTRSKKFPLVQVNSADLHGAMWSTRDAEPQNSSSAPKFQVLYINLHIELETVTRVTPGPQEAQQSLKTGFSFWESDSKML